MESYGVPRPDPETGLEEAMWQLGLGGGTYPERPGEPDCAYYIRTGTCGYGGQCRYNHPLDRGALAGDAMIGDTEYPVRSGRPACQFFLKTGTCKYGSTCKYDHPRQGGSIHPIVLNYLGFPLRQGEKECPYYMRTGHCKFGSTCKFHHPPPIGACVPSSPPAFYPGQSPLVPSTHQYSAIDVARSSMLPASYIHGPFGPVLLPPGIVSVYTQPLSPAASPGGQHSTQTGTVYGASTQLSPSAPAYQGTYVSSATGPSSYLNEQMFPERPGQPECQYYMKTRNCKYGSTCKYHHPPGRTVLETNCLLSPFGLPLRPGAPPCTFYAQHGLCKFGPTCKFDHPTGTLNYSPSASSLPDIPVAPYSIGISMGTLAPSSSSSELRPEFISNKDAFSPRLPSEGTSSGSGVSMFSKGSYLPHSLVQRSGQAASVSSRNNSTGHGGKMSSST